MQITVPSEINQALEDGAALAISISGGKDSTAMLLALVDEYTNRPEWTGEIFAIHADLGRIEWEGNLEIVERQAAELGIPLTVVRRPKGDMIDRWRQRMEKLQDEGRDVPFWSSASCRYCTSDMKRGPINTALRRYQHVISAEGIRAEESPARAKKPVWSVRKAIVTKTRRAYTWNPILDWKLEDVWERLGTSSEDLERRRFLFNAGAVDQALAGFPGHYAYVYGNSRLSCSICVLASKADIVNGVRHNRAAARQVAELEQLSGFTFKVDLSITELLRQVDAEEAQETAPETTETARVQVVGPRALEPQKTPESPFSVLVGECTGKMANRLEELGWGRCWIARDRRVYAYDSEPWILDNGAFRDWKKGVPFNHDLFRKVIYTKALPVAERTAPLFVVAPDIPGSGVASLAMSVEAAHPLTGYVPTSVRRYLAVQDGMTVDMVEPYVRLNEEFSDLLGRPFRFFDGLFLGGTNEFKATALVWRELTTRHGAGFHYGRCGTLAKVQHAKDVGADSIDSAFPMWSYERFEAFREAVAA